MLINTRVANKRTNLGNIYLENTYTNKTIVVNVNTTSLIKKKGTNCGIIIKKLSFNLKKIYSKTFH